MTDEPMAEVPRQARGNGLSAKAWVELCDVDPRLASPLLEVLRDADVPAYVAPSPGSTGHYLERRLPDRPTDRLWVDVRVRDEAERIVSSTLPQLHESLEDENWAQIVASFDAEAADDPRGSWPEVEGRVSTSVSYDEPPQRAPAYDEEDEHFVPPNPPPPPPARPVTRYGWTALFGGLALLVVPALLGNTLSEAMMLLAIGAIIGGFVTLVLQMKDSPPTDDGPDDGAVV